MDDKEAIQLFIVGVTVVTIVAFVAIHLALQIGGV